MKAITYTEYGSFDNLRCAEVEKPVPGDGEVLVAIQAASVNYGDTILVSGKPLVSRLWSGPFKPRYPILGGDIAGRVEAVGSQVTQFQPGDEVFADIGDHGFGAFAEYVAVPASALTWKPANLTFEQAAAVPQAAVVALQGLHNQGRLRSGHRVLVNGASGGVGTFAVQIARALGAEVTAVCSARHLDLARSIGADHVIDYRQQDFTQGTERYDLIFDIVANRSTGDYIRVLTPTGIYVACAFNPTVVVFGPLLSKKGGRQATSLMHRPNPADLAFLKDLLEAGRVVPVIDRCYPLNEVPDAMRYLGLGQHHGKVVISIGHNGR